MLTEKDYIEAARALGCEVAAIKAVDKIESRGNGFLANGKVKILYEPHVFCARTQGRFNKSHPHLSYPKWKSGQYGPESRQWAKLEEAMQLDRVAALESCSWGRFQIMGYHWRKLGYRSIDVFVEEMQRSESAHLHAFVLYVMAFGLADELQRKDWIGFAAGYNGPGYAANHYHIKLPKAYREFSR